MTDSTKALLWREGAIQGVEWVVLAKHLDQRGWLCEMWRVDELPPGGPGRQKPQMGYASQTAPGVLRGPHEHVAQTDIFVFAGEFEVFLWDARPSSPTYGVKQKIATLDVSRVIVPPGVVHAYRNIAASPQISFNFPDRLYKGWHRADDVDEIRHEDREGTQYAPW